MSFLCFAYIGNGRGGGGHGLHLSQSNCFVDHFVSPKRVSNWYAVRLSFCSSKQTLHKARPLSQSHFSTQYLYKRVKRDEFCSLAVRAYLSCLLRQATDCVLHFFCQVFLFSQKMKTGLFLGLVWHSRPLKFFDGTKIEYSKVSPDAKRKHYTHFKMLDFVLFWKSSK